MNTPKAMILALVLLARQAAMAESGPLNGPNPLGDLQSQIDALGERIATLENKAPTPDVDGRSYCMMVTVTVLRGYQNTATEVVETPVVRRLAIFSGGSFSATVVSDEFNAQTGNGIIESVPGTAPVEISGTYTQTGRQLNLELSNGNSGTWYVSGDGSVIHNNSIEFFGPFPNSLTLGLVRSATFIESAGCEGG